MAFARFLFISSPECPPVSPFTVTRKKKYPSGAAIIEQGNLAVVPAPPAQPINNSPSSSESRFINMSPSIKPSFIEKAPVNPVSSSTVNTHWIGPCSISSEARIANSAAIPIPLSAPNVVPFALNHSPSI